MNKIRLNQNQRIGIFLNEYYFGYGPYYTWLRLIAGPSIVLMGFYLYNYGQSKPGIGYAGFMIIFGIYYFLKPLTFVLFKKKWFDNLEFDYTLSSDKIIILDKESKSEINFSAFKKVFKRKSYYVLRTNDNKSIYLPNASMESGDIKILEDLIKK